MDSKKISDLGDAKGTRFMEFGRKVFAMAARYRRDISIVIVEIRNQPAADENALADLQAAGTKTMFDCDYVAACGDRGFLFLLPETPPNGAEAFAGRLRRAVPDNFPAIQFGITGWSPSAVAPGILSLVSTAAEALDSAHAGGAAAGGLCIKLA